MSWIAKCFLVVSLIALTACASAGKMWPEQTGVVLDEETKKPIEGAIVVARWIGTISQLVDSQTTCYHVESATTDAQGRYRIPEWTKSPGKVGHNEVQFTAYKPGYRHVRMVRATGDQYLKKDAGSVKERLEYLLSMSNNICFSEEFKNLIPMQEAATRESELIASTDEEKALSRRIHFYLDVLKVGWDEAYKRKN